MYGAVFNVKRVSASNDGECDQMKKGNNLPSDQAEAPLVLSAFCFTDAHAWVSQSASLSFIISRATRGAAGCTICSRSMEVPLLEFHRQLSKYRRPTKAFDMVSFSFPMLLYFHNTKRFDFTKGIPMPGHVAASAWGGGGDYVWGKDGPFRRDGEMNLERMCRQWQNRMSWISFHLRDIVCRHRCGVVGCPL